MKLEAYSVHDSAVGAFNRPQFFRARGEAVRSFADAVANPEAGFRAHAEHFSFWRVGYFDDADGLFEPVKPERVCGAVDFLIESSPSIGG
nr:MAG: nonstructural protein [Microvirus sp.]